MATHSSSLAWKIPWTEEPGRLQSMGSRRVEHDCVTIAHSLSKHTTTYNIDKQGPTVWHRELQSIFFNNLHVKRI